MEILLIFKTHLDLGYTDLAENVERRYMREFIPHALDLAETTAGTPDPFVWTTGAWLIERFLQSGEENRIRMEAAIRNGLITWHALPFTVHAEMMDGPLYDRGLEAAKRLDARFGKKTIAAKSTDVPGMTRAVVPHLAKAGVRLLHVGVNPFSAVPDVPDVFRWQAPTGESVTVIYSKVYGETTPLPGTDKILCFAMTNDNLGPQTPGEIHEFYGELRRKYPGAAIRAASLNDAAEALEEAAPELPVVTSEIGDSWAHGYQADPGKQYMFRELLRYAPGLPDAERDRVYDALLLTAEHTCGVNGVNFIADDGHYGRAEFEERRAAGKYARSECSWQEQREYALRAAESLPEPYGTEAKKRMSGYLPAAAPETGADVPVMRDMYPGTEVCLGRFCLTVGYDGAVYGIRLDGRTVVSPKKRLLGFAYDLYSPAETLRFCEQYQKERLSWGYDDFSKRGLESARSPRISCGAVAQSIRATGDTLVCRMACEPLLHEKYGCPASLVLTLSARDDCLDADFAWYGKPAVRIPECLSLELDNPGTGVSVRKLGEWIDPCDTVSRGGRALHGNDGAFRLGTMEVATRDCALVSFGSGVWCFDDRLPQPSDGARVILYDNQWNTNFPFWYDEDAHFRFTLSFGEDAI